MRALFVTRNLGLDRCTLLLATGGGGAAERKNRCPDSGVEAADLSDSAAWGGAKMAKRAKKALRGRNFIPRQAQDLRRRACDAFGPCRRSAGEKLREYGVHLRAKPSPSAPDVGGVKPSFYMVLSSSHGARADRATSLWRPDCIAASRPAPAVLKRGAMPWAKVIHRFYLVEGGAAPTTYRVPSLQRGAKTL